MPDLWLPTSSRPKPDEPIKEASAVKRRIMPSREYLQEVLSYDPQTGFLTWKVRRDAPNSWNAKYPGKRAFACEAGRYFQGSLNDRMFLAHRIIWQYVHGTVPDLLDHRDGNGHNNALCNLRECTAAQNNQNKVFACNKTGFKGVKPFHRRWIATIRENGKPRYLGSFSTKEEAGAAYAEAARVLHGEFMKLM